MDRFCTIQYKTVTYDTYGASIETWATRTQIWAERRELNMTERLQAQQVEANISGRYYVRYNSTINEKDRLVDGSNTYEITGIVEIGRKLGMILICGTI